MLPKPLAGVRVLDLSRVVAGPMCGRILADLGADVVKIEPPDLDPTRKLPPQVDGMSVYFAQMNAGKRNVCVNLKAPGAAELVQRLAGHSDVVVENFRPGVLARFGLDAPALLHAHPRLVYCSISGWGQEGPWADRRCYAPLVHAETGMIEMAARVRGRPPEQEAHVHGDMYPALLAANAVLAALLQRATTGTGQHLDVAMGEAVVYANDWAAVELQRFEGEQSFDIWTNPVLRLADGTAAALSGNPVRRFGEWVRALGGDAAILADHRFATAEGLRAHVDEAVAVLAELMAGVADFASLEARLYPMLAGEVRSLAALAETPWAGERRLVTEVAPGLPLPTAPWRSTGATVGVAGPAGRLGEHNREVLGEWAGLDDPEIDRLTAAGVLGPPPEPAD